MIWSWAWRIQVRFGWPVVIWAGFVCWVVAAFAFGNIWCFVMVVCCDVIVPRLDCGDLGDGLVDLPRSLPLSSVTINPTFPVARDKPGSGCCCIDPAITPLERILQAQAHRCRYSIRRSSLQHAVSSVTQHKILACPSDGRVTCQTQHGAWPSGRSLKGIRVPLSSSSISSSKHWLCPNRTSCLFRVSTQSLTFSQHQQPKCGFRG
jgi:hypothetical protein